jgi:hypothetical protein
VGKNVGTDASSIALRIAVMNPKNRLENRHELDVVAF